MKDIQKQDLISLFLQDRDNKITLTLGNKHPDDIVSNYSQFSGQEIVNFLLPQEYDKSKNKMCFGTSKDHASFKRSMDKDPAILKAIAEFDRNKKIENIANLYVAMINAYYKLYNELSIPFYSIKSSDDLFGEITTIPEERQNDSLILYQGLYQGNDNEVKKLVQRDIRTYGLFRQYNKIPLDMTDALAMDDNIISSVKTLIQQKNWISRKDSPELLSSLSLSLWDYIRENKQIIQNLKKTKDAKDVFKVLKENILSQIKKQKDNSQLQNIVLSLKESKQLIVDKDILNNIQNQDILKAILLYNMFVLKNTMIDVIDRNQLSENDINEMLWVQKNSKEEKSNVLLFGYKTRVFTRHECLMLADQYFSIEYLNIDKTLKTKYDNVKNQLSSMDKDLFKQSLSSMDKKYDSVKNKLSSIDEDSSRQSLLDDSSSTKEDSQSKGKSFFVTVLLLVFNWIKSSFTKKTVETNSQDVNNSQPQDSQAVKEASQEAILEQNIENNAPKIPADKESLIITKIYRKDKGYYVTFQNGDDLLGCGQGYYTKDNLLEVQNSSDIQGLIQDTTIIKSMIDKINTVSNTKRTEIELTQALNVYGAKNTKQSFVEKVQGEQEKDSSLNIS